jgi:HEAT repeat protein
LAYVSALRGDASRYAVAMDALEEVLRPLWFGLAPAVGRLDPARLEPLTTPVVDILSWLADSDKADLKTAAIALMSALGWETFLPRLNRSLRSSFVWERAAAVDALARIGTPAAHTLLRSIGDDPDPAIRAAIRQAIGPGDHRPGGRE